MSKNILYIILLLSSTSYINSVPTREPNEQKIRRALDPELLDLFDNCLSCNFKRVVDHGEEEDVEYGVSTVTHRKKQIKYLIAQKYKKGTRCTGSPVQEYRRIWTNGQIDTVKVSNKTWLESILGDCIAISPEKTTIQLYLDKQAELIASGMYKEY